MARKEETKLKDTQIEVFNKLKVLCFKYLILRPKHWEKAKTLGKITFGNLLKEMEIY